MSQLQTKLTRNSSDDPLDADLVKRIDDAYLPTLQNLSVVQPKKLLVSFSGPTCMGKSTMSAFIAGHLQPVVLNYDNMKRAMLSVGIGEKGDYGSIHELSWRYSLDLFSRISDISPNGFIVRDAIIDWYFGRILPVFEQQGFDFFFIGGDLSDDFHIKLIKARGDTDLTTVERLISVKPDHKQHMANFRQQYDIDYMVTDDNFGDWQPIVEMLQARLAG